MGLSYTALLVGIQNGTTTLENSLRVSYELKYTLIKHPNDPTSRYLPKRNESICPEKDLHVNVYNSLYS